MRPILATCLLTAVLLPGAVCAQAPSVAAAGTDAGADALFVSVDGKPLRKRCRLSARHILWSPDRLSLLVSDAPAGIPGTLWLVRVRETDGPLELARGAVDACWAPDSRRIAFVDGSKGVRVLDIGSRDSSLVRGTEAARMPVWSPTGREIAFGRSTGVGSVWLASADGSAAFRICSGLAPTRLAWSPDGRRLAVISADQSRRIGGRLSIVELAGIVRTVGPAMPDFAVWSPDSARVLIEGIDGPEVLQADDGLSTALTEGGGSPQGWLSTTEVLVWRGGVLRAAAVDSRAPSRAVWPGPKGQPLPQGLRLVTAPNWIPTPKHETARATPTKPQNAPEPMPAPSTIPSKPPARALRGQMVLGAVVRQADPVSGVLRLDVSTVTFDDGQELNLVAPESASLWMGLSGRGVGVGPRSRRRSSAPRSGMEIRLTVEADEDGSGLRLLSSEPITQTAAGPPGPDLGDIEPDGVSRARVVVPMTFPVLGEARWSDTFLADRDGGKRRHHGQDVAAPKMRPLVAAFDGTVWLITPAGRGGHYYLYLSGDNGWTAAYMHLNNDTPGTDDGLGTIETAFAPGLRDGDHVVAGQLVGFVGDSGNAEGSGPHLHFELHRDGAVVNADPSMRAAARINEPRPPQAVPVESGDSGDARLDGVVRGVDPAARTMDVEVSTGTLPSRGGARRGRSTTIRVRLQEGCKLGPSGRSASDRDIGALSTGMRIAVLGRGGDDDSFTAGRIYLDLPSLTPSPALLAACSNHIPRRP